MFTNYRKFQKIMVSCILVIFIINLVIILLETNKVEAASYYTQSIASGIAAFPDSYKSYLNELKEQHPNWNFEAYYTGISWDTLVENEVVCGKNRVIKSADSLWRCSCGNIESGYACASPSIIKYYMDPRNFLKNDVVVFQFLEMTYNSNVQTIEGVQSIIKNTFMNSTVHIEGHGDMTYAQIIMEAAKESRISPYSIATKIIQEVGTKGSASVSGTYGGYEGYYNFFNYGSNDEGDAIANGLNYAKNKGWNNQFTSIVEGAKLLADSYVNQGQNTAYFYKWDVVGNSILQTGGTVVASSSNLFNHQYMTNVQDPTGQTSRLYNTYLSNDVLDASLNFIIPVYDNMPGLNKLPTTLTEADGELYYSIGSGIYVRTGPGTNYDTVGYINMVDEVVAMIQRECSVDSTGRSWDKVKLSNGIIGYVASQYFKTCTTSDKTEVEEAIGTASVFADGGLKMRSEASTSSVMLTLIPNEANIEIMQKDVSENNGYNWFRIRYNGITGYVASKYLTNIKYKNGENNNNNDNNNNNNSNTDTNLAKFDGDKVIATPNLTESILIEKLGTTNCEVKNGEKVLSSSDKIGTGFVLINKETGESKIIIVKGDTNGDATIDSSDLLTMQKYLLKVKQLDEKYLNAADVNMDAAIDSSDLLKIQKYLLGVSNINI